MPASDNATVSSSADPRRTARLLAAVTVVAVVLRAIRLDSGLWMDEAAAAFVAFRLPLREILTVYPGDIHHPLYSLLAHVAMVVLGESAWVMRLPSVVGGAAAVPVLFWLTRRVATEREAWCVAVLVAVSYPHVWFSQNARGYTLLALAAAITTFLLVRFFEEGDPRDLLLYALAAGLGAFTHVTMIFIVVGHAGVWALRVLWRLLRGTPVSRPEWLAALAFPLAAATTLILYSPMTGDVLWWFLHRPSELEGVSTPGWALAEARRILVQSFGADVALVAGFVVGTAGFFSYLRRAPWALWMFVAPGVVTIVGALVARGTMYPRFFFALSAFGFMIFVRGLFALAELTEERWSKVWPRRLAVAAVALTALVSLAALTHGYRYPKQDYLGAAAYVEENREAGDVVVGVGSIKYASRDYYEEPWHFVDSLEELEAVRSRGGATWLVYTFPRYVAAANPGVFEMIEKHCANAIRFRGTVGDGDVRVCRLTREAFSRP